MPIAKLCRPYQFVAKLKETETFLKNLRNALKPYAEPLQCQLVDKKPISKGIRLTIFVLGKQPHYSGDGSPGISKKQWQQISNIVKTHIQGLLGEKAVILIDPWNKSSKFSITFETYIQYIETL